MGIDIKSRRHWHPFGINHATKYLFFYNMRSSYFEFQLKFISTTPFIDSGHISWNFDFHIFQTNI